MKKLFLAITSALLVFMVNASGVGQGVYFYIDDSVWEGDDYVGRVHYTCSESHPGRDVSTDEGLNYCRNEAILTVTYYDKTDDGTLGKEQGIKYLTLLDEEATHCQTGGYAVIWDVKRLRTSTYHAARTECKEVPEKEN